MKVSIGTNIKDGPWGGGNLFAINLKNYLESKGIQVVNNLDTDDIDIILITEPRKTSESSAFTHTDVLKYLSFKNENALVVHRINECDERKGTKYVNKYLIDANKVADATVFVSTWIKNLYINQGITSKYNKVILSGANSSIFNKDNFVPYSKGGKVKIVTHHWGANWNKGFDIYKKLDLMLEEEYWSNQIEFTYVGNLPKNFNFKNTKVVSPLSGNNLSKEIKKHNLYLTASLNEPSGNHHIEAAQCGLPLLYIDSGGIPEYCQDYGLGFVASNFEDKLSKIIGNYQHYLDLVNNYPLDADIMSKNYLSLFLELINSKDTFLNQRRFKKITSPLKRWFYLKIDFFK
jgi:glycosyltransferase involved in cell wall biosynthesis|tara:strand:- start:29 stop:1069 length:1041 start_codon:yes stop_codon:yes gene_type:complete